MSKTKYVASTGIMLALLIVVQFVFRGLGQIVTGTGVNLILAISAMFLGYAGSITLAILSPFFAFLLGIGPAFLPIVPCIAVGNLCYVLCICLATDIFFKKKEKKYTLVAVIIAAIIKFIALYLLVVKLAVPSLGLPEAKQQTISAMFTFPQLITALAGGSIASIIQYYIKKADSGDKPCR